MNTADKYIENTSGLYDYSDWVEVVIDKMSDRFFKENSVWIDDEGRDSQVNKWLSKLYDCDPSHAAKVIERTFSLYKLENK